MNIRELIIKTGIVLKEAGIEEYILEAELFLAHTLNRTRLDILTDSFYEVSKKDQQIFEDMIKRRSLCEPAAYIIGTKEFMGLDFKVKPGILIPRPDTETLVEAVIEKIKEKGFKKSAEVGIGSGCISISIAKYTDIECVGSDISPVAVETAVENAKNNEVEDRVKFYLGDVFKGIPEGKYDIVVSNPPYIRQKDMETLMDDVKNYEPHTALYGGKDGLDFYRRITEEGKELLNDGGYIFYEIGYDEAVEVSQILEVNGFVDIEVVKDLSGLDRVVSARKGDF